MGIIKEGAKSILGKRNMLAVTRRQRTKAVKEKGGRYARTQSQMKQQGCCNTLVESNEAFKLELPRAWELLDSSKPS